MRYGTIIDYFPDKGFGFIRPDVGPDIYFHVTALGACESQPKISPGQPVKYELLAKKPHKLSGRETPAQPRQKERLQAKLVELIDKLPGASLDDVAGSSLPARHPRARRKKPDWRR